MHRFIALQEQRSNAGKVIRPGDFVPELEGASHQVQQSNVNQCMALDLDGEVLIDQEERGHVRKQAALIGDIEAARGIDLGELRGQRVRKAPAEAKPKAKRRAKR